jgi:hypothetical protein
MNTYICPVCAYRDLEFPPTEDMICPCCGTQFGLDDDVVSHQELRDNWINSGTKWYSEYMAAPRGWSARRQLALAGCIVSVVQFVDPCETPVATNSKFNTARTTYAIAA